MKKIIFILSILISTSVLAQDNVKLNVCGKPVLHRKMNNATFEHITLSLKEMENCFEINTNNKNWKVTFFMMGYKVGLANQGINIKGNKINPKALELLKKNNPKKITIEKIKITNTAGKTKYYGSFTIDVK